MCEMKSLEAALWYATKLNWAVFPLHSVVDGKCTCGKDCPSPAKHPRTSNGVLAATTDTHTIRNWFTKHPISNVGIATGRISGIFVLDVDTHLNDGYDTLEALTDQYGQLPDTVQAITGSGGSHFFFKYAEGIGNKTNLFRSIDIRGDGGYIVAAPSVHISGKKYEFEVSSYPHEQPIAEAPEWLIQAIQGNKSAEQKKHTSGHWSSIMSGLSEGEGRNNAAASLAGHLLRRYIDPYLVIEIMHLWNERNDPPLAEEELKTILNSIAGKELKRRKGG